MASQYYLISSLPDLRTDGEMPFSYEEFLGMCQSNVSESKYELLKNLTLSSEEGPLLKEWSAFYKNLMGEVGLHTFDDVYLFGYAIKLKLLERQSCFVQSKGQKEFKRLFDQVQQRVYSL